MSSTPWVAAIASAKVEPLPMEPLNEIETEENGDKYKPSTEVELIKEIVQPSDKASLRRQISNVVASSIAKVVDYAEINVLKEDYSVLPDLSESNVDKEKAIIRVRELLVSKQQREHQNPKSVFNLIYNDKLPPLKRALQKNPDLISDGDAVGANPVHVAYLYKKYEIGRWIVSNYPDESLLPYSTRSTFRELPERFMPYYGENILHMCIIRRDHTEVRFLLDFYRERLMSVPSVTLRKAAIEKKAQHPTGTPTNLNSNKLRVAAGSRKVDYSETGLSIMLFAKATGTFFARDGGFYCGETPLHFAVCCGDTDMFDMVLAYAASERPNALFERDSYGNTLLHLCVMHNLTDMYKHVLGAAHSQLSNQIMLACADAFGDCAPVLKPMSAEKLDEEEFATSHVFNGSCPRESALPYAPVYDEVYIEHHTKQKLSERLTLVLNSDLHSPLTYAASLGNHTMLTFLVDQMKVFRWQYGPVSVSSVDLDGLERPHNLLRYGPNPCLPERHQQVHRQPGEPAQRVSKPLPPMEGRDIWGAPIGVEVYGAIEHLCEKYLEDDSVLDAFDNEFIKDLINAKWDRSAFYEFRRDGIVAFIITVCLTLISCVINFIPTLKRGTQEGSNILALLYSILFIFVSLVSIKEIPQVLAFRLDYWGLFGGIRGAAIYEKLCMTVLVISFYLLCLMETIRANSSSDNSSESNLPSGRRYVEGENGRYLVDAGVEVCLVVSAMSAWSYLFFCFMGFDYSGPFVLKIFKIIKTDVPFFLGFFAIVILAYSVAVSVISNIDQEVFEFEYGFVRFLYTIWTFLKITVGTEFVGDMVDILNVPPQLRWLFDILMASYGFVASLLMLNLLIAIVGTSYDDFSQAADQLLLLERYNIMCGYERGMTEAEKNDRLETFAIGDKIDVDGVVIMANFEDDAETTTSSHRPLNLGDIHKSSWSLSKDFFSYVSYWFDQKKDEAGEMKQKIKAMVSQKPDVTNGESIRWNYKWEVHDPDWFNREREEVYMPDSDTVKIVLLIIDPQNDFHDDPGDKRGYKGTLAVEGATADSLRISEMIRKHGEDIDEIYVTLDTHHVSSRKICLCAFMTFGI